ncbi:hypothetical protein GSY69_11865 [Brevibacterium sp. 5221]|uniref:Bax inhibitor-1/YccA family protein n=1 Tax=Brevibacterium rongguiense TaxID=2695267 RepID=A0A6N9H9B9_9MICO|nr:Bax inhibitor-1/YccA family protein [Brevibacterium rongguiense]MYM20637.1 hypothetical protein [Brevibacterium rongguiense]
MSNPMMRRSLNEGTKAGQQLQTPSADQLNAMYMAPSAQPQRPVDERVMTYDDVFMKSLLCFAVLLVGAAVGWFAPILTLPAVLGGLVLGLVNAFKKEPSPGLILAYAAVEGVALGGISRAFEGLYNGIVMQAILATLCVFGVMFALFKAKIVRNSPKLMKFLLIAVGGYAIFSLISFGITLVTGFNMRSDVHVSLFGMSFPIGVLISGIAIVLAALTLITDFDMVEQGVRNRIPERYSWLCAFSLMTTLVWLYIEILRLLSYLRSN